MVQNVLKPHAYYVTTHGPLSTGETCEFRSSDSNHGKCLSGYWYGIGPTTYLPDAGATPMTTNFPSERPAPILINAPRNFSQVTQTFFINNIDRDLV